MSGCQFDKDSWMGFCRACAQSKVLFRIELDQINLAKCNLADLRDSLQQVRTVLFGSIERVTVCFGMFERVTVLLGMFERFTVVFGMLERFEIWEID
jgi:hypothetical protein